MLSRALIFFFLILSFATAAMSQNKLLDAPEVIPPATAAMQTPSFWIDRIDNPDRVIMTAPEIERFNAKNRSRSLTGKRVNGDHYKIDPVLSSGNFSGIIFNMDDPLAITTFSGAELKEHLGRVKTYLEKQLWDRRQIPYPAWRKAELVEELDIAAVPAQITPRYGITVRHTLNRFTPTHEKAYGGQYGWLDMFQNAVLETNTPVAILHSSKNGDWLYVRSHYSFGWVPADCIATGNADKIRSVADFEDFIVATSHKVPVYADRACTVWHGDLYMGGRLELRGKEADYYDLSLPVRMADGRVGTINGFVKADATVSVGYQTYTQRNVIETFFRLLNRPYGWGGTGHERDCVGTIRAVLRTFDIDTPRWTVYQLNHTDHVISFPADTPVEEKYRYLDSCEPGITVTGFDWHVLLYLGKVDGVHYVIHQNGYSYHDKDGNEIRVGRVAVNHTELEGGADIKRWTELSVFKK